MKILALLAAILLPVSLVRADITIVQNVKQEGGSKGVDINMTIKVKDQKARIDVNPDISTIVDLSSGDSLSLFHSRKAAMRLPGAAIKAMQAKVQQEQGELKADLPKATGRKETINGFACEEYETTVDGRKVELWLTKDAPDAQKALSQLSALSGNGDPISSFIEKNQLAGFPVRTVVDTPMGKVTTTVVTVKPGEIDATQFTIPSEYKEVQAPAMPGVGK
ncbi:hypothetical protein DB345_12525 [Spartobacteria bacterium LR76]|nr:hypothetical protein DB345_12525 [Spartobacteria bacterium LR76]